MVKPTLCALQRLRDDYDETQDSCQMETAGINPSLREFPQIDIGCKVSLLDLPTKWSRVEIP